MLSAMLGIVHVDIIEEFDSSASQVALMLSLYRGITFGGSKLEVKVFKHCLLLGHFCELYVTSNRNED